MIRKRREDEMDGGRDHPLRVTLSELMHLRALPLDRAPVRLRQWVFLVEPEQRAAETAFVTLFAPGQDPAAGRVVVTNEEGGWLWERHQEFSTWTGFAYGPLGGELGFETRPEESAFWLDGAPGQVFRGVEISVSAPRGEPPTDAALRRHIDLARCVSCEVFDGAARIWTDFRLREGGTGRIHVHNISLANDEVSRLVQTLLEIGNYRKLALIGFPPARELLAWLDGAEARLAAITSGLAAGEDSQSVLDHLLALSAEIELRAADSRFRRGATESYHRLTLDRLEALRERRVAGHSTMSEFIARRLLPAMRTREAADRRLDDLSLRVARSGDLLRTKLGLAQDRQNQETLRGMDASLQLQTKLQGLVEGLSIFAVGYYVLGLLGYLLKPWLHGWPGGGERVLSALVPLVLIAVAASLHRRKKRLIDEGR
ncbi:MULTISPECIES: DUF3422 domain-containing protein [unclassified Caulobacter]|uniref:DUF3422 domain-containing protein n=1 Tax=unclassified Caulobacter TaxID=2648921 RepID=UPI0009EBA314|nr:MULTISPECIES: DUF3422 family protein [unclassified Caulobacter]